ncbi:winged helix-turn-helix domain-containing protein [Paucibacter sp. PLA-PC-4]|uniref:winged helix-turn-helix domain-containing protein n=1 Tax=Paucibacter sp. PLA-PC-4 TaxID=2993655 RepID=UPI00224A7584|nr:winged helix-turn-helix domain-containing protein [Paucibacter sp. PLA-PC-4]MCX2863562.1 winged helix-turn-helix domain-containing protein [Paucibacter sp. PLA-PC-4]
MEEATTELDRNITMNRGEASSPVLTEISLDRDGMPWVNGRLLKVSRQERLVLVMLVERQPGVVSKDDFSARVWANQAMSDEGLAMCISRLRRALRPHGWDIAAEYGVGYRLRRDGRSSAENGSTDDSHPGYEHARKLLEQRSPAAVGVALRLLREVVTKDQAHGAARIALADALAIAIGWGQTSTPDAVSEGLAALGQIEDPGLFSAAEAARGALLDLAWRFDDAAVCFERSLHAEHSDTRSLLAYSRHQLYMNQAVSAVETLRRIRRLSPHALAPRMVLSRALVLCDRGDEAVAEIASASQDHPGDLAVTAFELAIQAVVNPRPELRSTAIRMTEGAHTPTFVWSVSSFVLARLQERETALDIIDSVLLCSRTTTGEAALYAAPLAELGYRDRAAALLEAAFNERCGMLAMILRDPGNTFWLSHDRRGSALLAGVFGPRR